MATWHGTPKKFQLEVYDPKDYGYAHDEDVEYNWEYNTTSDILKVMETDSNGTEQTLHGKERALALLHTLAEWCYNFEGKEALKNLLKDIVEEDNETNIKTDK